MLVVLTPWELVFDVIAGLLRHLLALIADRKDQFDTPNPIRQHILGVMGENALAKLTDSYWFPLFGTPFEAPSDLSRKRQVRTVTHAGIGLIFRPRDLKKGYAGHAFALVVAKPPQFEFKGWARGWEIMKNGDRMPADKKGPGYWRMPVERLHQLGEAVPEVPQRPSITG